MSRHAERSKGAADLFWWGSWSHPHIFSWCLNRILSFSSDDLNGSISELVIISISNSRQDMSRGQDKTSGGGDWPFLMRLRVLYLSLPCFTFSWCSLSMWVRCWGAISSFSWVDRSASLAARLWSFLAATSRSSSLFMLDTPAAAATQTHQHVLNKKSTYQIKVTKFDGACSGSIF